MANKHACSNSCNQSLRKANSNIAGTPDDQCQQQFHLGLARSHVGSANGSPNAEFPGAYLPGHTTVDLTLGKNFGEKFTVSVTGLNIANRHLLIDNSLTFGGFHYNDPREIYVEFRWRFHY